MEMGRRDLMKRGGTNKQSGSGFSSKSKKRMLADEQLKQKMNFKLPKKDTNGVDHASVPRKLRSAMMKKRNLESVSKVSSISKRLNRSKTGTESIKKENQEMVESMMISNDEKEVAETLYGLAEMFTETEACHEKEAESFEPVVSVLSSDKTKELDAKPLVQSDDQLSSPVTALETKVATSDMNRCLALWPGLSSGAQVHSKSSSTTLPPWMSQATSPSMSASVPKLKRCASHVYISRLIKVLQTSKSSSPTTLAQTEQRSSDMSVTTISDFKTMVSQAKMYQNPHLLNLQRTHNSKLVPEDRTNLALDLYGPHTSQKQSYNFLTLSSSGPTSSLQYHISAAYNSQLSPATSLHQVQQLTPYLANRFQTAYNANQKQQLQKRLWTAQYRPQYSTPNLSLNLTSIQQPLLASSPRYNNNNVSQKKHRLMATAATMSMNHHLSNNPSRTVMNRQEHHFPLIYEDTRTPVQLLCNEQS